MELTQRIVESAIRLADRGGFQAVKLREIASESGVGLGTLYTRFRSKEDILVAALEEEMNKLDMVLQQFPAQGDTRLERVDYFFTLASRAMFARQNFARAVLRSVASGDEELAGRVLSFHDRMGNLIVASMHGKGPNDTSYEPSEAEKEVSYLLQQAWFALLIGWMGGLHSEDDVLEKMQRVTLLLMRGCALADF